jgi:hypothetical protein
MNRFNNISNIKTNRTRSARSQPASNTSVFVPKINKNSKAIDMKRNAVSRDSRFNILLKAGTKYKNNLDKKSSERQSTELKKCTFYPDLQKSSFKVKENKPDLNQFVSMISDITDHNPLKRQTSRNQEDKFIRDVNQISPIDRNESKIKFTKKAKVTLPYKPLPDTPADKKVKKVKTYKPTYVTRNKQLPTKTHSARKHNYEDEVIFKTNTTENVPISMDKDVLM